MTSYKTIPEFPNYEINKCGQIRNKTNGKIKSQYPSNGGYYFVTLHKENKGGKPRRVHRLLAQAFIDNPENKPCINHIDGCKGNYEMSNLEWCTTAENAKHAKETGLTNNTGTRNGMSKINERTARLIKSKLASGLTQQKIADNMGISRSLVSAINIGRLWSHV